jgi:hypothetical protein
MGFLSSLFGVSDRTPKTSNVVTSTKLPTELAPYVTDVLGEAQDLYKAEVERGYDPYTGQTIAPLSAEEQQAMTGITGLTGTTSPYIQEALGTYRKGGDEFTAETAEKFMSPYQQAVTDVQLREAQENFEGNTMPKFEAKAISQGGGMSGLGTRAGIEAAELQRGQSQLLADIQAKGSQASFQDARQAFEAQQARERQMAGDIGRTGPALFQAGLAEAGALQTVGQQKRELGQSALDEAYAKFLQEQNFPKQQIADYSSTIYGSAPSFKTGSGSASTSGLPGAPSMGQQLLGMGLTGLNIYGAGTKGGTQGFNFGAAGQNLKFKEGGQVSGGLPTLNRNIGGGLGDDEQGFPMESDENIGRFVRETEDIPDTGQPTMSDSQQRQANFYKEILKAQKNLGDRSIESKGIATKLNTDVKAENIAANTRQTDLTNKSFGKREKKLEERSKRYPFNAFQKGIAAGMKEATIAMMFTQGIAVTGEELEKKADELDIMVDALEQQKFGVESKQESEQSAKLLENLKGDANLQLRLLALDTKTQLDVLKLMKQGLDIDAALAKAGKGKKLKLTTAILSDKSDAINSALGFKGDFKVDAAGNSNYVGKRADGGDLTDVDVQKIARYNVIWSTVYSNANSKGLDGVAASALAQDAVIKQQRKDSTSSKVNTPPPPGTKPVATPSTTAQNLAPPIQ